VGKANCQSAKTQGRKDAKEEHWHARSNDHPDAWFWSAVTRRRFGCRGEEGDASPDSAGRRTTPRAGLKGLGVPLDSIESSMLLLEPQRGVR
jgi:hypothetical protein